MERLEGLILYAIQTHEFYTYTPQICLSLSFTFGTINDYTQGCELRQNHMLLQGNEQQQNKNKFLIK